MQSEPIDSQWELRNADQTPGRTAAAVARVGSAFYQFGGQDSSGNISQQIFRYETSNNSWTLAGFLPQVKRYFSAARVGNRVYLPGGDTALDTLQTSITAKHYAFDLGNNSPIELADLPNPTAWSQSVAVPGITMAIMLSVVWGINGKFIRRFGVSMTTTTYGAVWRYDIGSDSWGANPVTKFDNTQIWTYGRLF